MAHQFHADIQGNNNNIGINIIINDRGGDYEITEL
jgi:hypothetical protein